MTPSRWVIRLARVIAALSFVAATAGLVAASGDGPFTFISVRGQSVQIHGQGLYRYDSLFTGAANRGTDAVTLLLAVPLLALSLRRYQRGSPRGALLLLSALGYFVYVYGSLALGTAWNDLFLIYVALLSASFFAICRLLASQQLRTAAPRLFARAPRRGPALFLIGAGLVTALIWLAPVLAALVSGKPPPLLDHATTTFTYALDLAVIVPATMIAGVLIWRRDPLGYLAALPLLGIVILLAPAIVAGTVSQLRAGIVFTTAQLVGPIASFMVLGALATWVLVAIVRAVSETGGPAQTVPHWYFRHPPAAQTLVRP